MMDIINRDGKRYSRSLNSEDLRQARNLLAGGQWIERCVLFDFCKSRKLSFEAAAEALYIAESDSARFLCIPKDATPLLPPDEHSLETVFTCGRRTRKAGV